MNFYDEYKWCRKCNRYVNFMRTVDASFCVHCDSRLLIFSDEDYKKFHLTLKFAVNFENPLRRQ